MDIPTNLGSVPRLSSGRITVNPHLGLGQVAGRVENWSPGTCTERPSPPGSQPYHSRSDIQSSLGLGVGLGVGSQPLVQDRKGLLQNGKERVESSLSDTGNVLSTQSEYLGTWANYVNPQQVFEASVAAKQPISTAFGVPESVKRKAWQGKNVPLYMFLTGFSEQEPGGNPVLMPVPGEGGQFTLTMSIPDQSRKLSQRQLPPTEFGTAFLRYKDVMLEHFPERSEELDAYLAHILGLACSYTGNAYWHNHSLFTKKAASLLERRVKVHWGIPDPVLSAIASQRANYFEHCQNILHPTGQCPFSVAPVSKTSSGRRAP